MAEQKDPGSTSSYTHTQITNINRATREKRQEPTRKDRYSTTKDIKMEPNKEEGRA